MEQSTAPQFKLWWIALVLHLVVGFLCFSLGLSIPPPVWLSLMAAWAVLLVVLIRFWRRSPKAFVAPAVALVLWGLVGWVLAERFNWTA